MYVIPEGKPFLGLATYVVIMEVLGRISAG